MTFPFLVKWHLADVSREMGDVCLWPKADIPTALMNVRFRGVKRTPDFGHLTWIKFKIVAPELS
jgi:hypothetical protein